MVKDVWDTAVLCELQFQDWRQTLWSDIRTDIMEEGAKQFVKEVKSLHKKVSAPRHAVYATALACGLGTSPAIPTTCSSCVHALLSHRYWCYCYRHCLLASA